MGLMPLDDRTDPLKLRNFRLSKRKNEKEEEKKPRKEVEKEYSKVALFWFPAKSKSVQKPNFSGACGAGQR